MRDFVTNSGEKSLSERSDQTKWGLSNHFATVLPDNQLCEMICRLHDLHSSIVWATNVDGMFLYVNKVYCDSILLIDDITEPLGRSTEYYFDRFKSENHESLNWHTIGESLLLGDEHVCKYKKPIKVIIEGFARGMKLVYEVDKIPFLDGNGEFIGIINVGNDITERHTYGENLRLDEERLHLAMIGANMGVWDWDVRNGKLIIDERWLNYYGYKRTDFDNNFESFKMYIHPDDLLRHENTLLNYFRNPVNVMEDDYRVRKSNGEYFWIKSIGIIVEYSGDGEPQRMVGIHRDITKAKNQEKELLEAKLKAEESDRLKTAFLANLSHEIRTPLNSILGFTKFLLYEEGLSKETKEEYMKIVENSSESFLQIINSIIDMAKLETNTFKLSFSSFNIHQVLLKTIKNLKSNHHYSDRINLQFSFNEEQTDQDIFSDRDVIGQIVYNLLSNAIKFTREGMVELGYEILDGKGLFIFVKDSGIGIDVKHEKIIYQPFRQLDESFKRAYGGAGLGLSIAFQMVNILKGKLWFESEKDKGTIFYVYLPISSKI